MAARRVGVEEELLVVERDGGSPAPVADEIIARCRAGTGPAGATVKPEFFRCQVELNSRPHRVLAEVTEELAEGRVGVAAAAHELGAAALAVGGPPVAPHHGTVGLVSEGERYAAIRSQYGAVADASLMCALHVHVEVADAEEGVAVINRVRPWVPLLVALSANSPYWCGTDTGYESWRSRVWSSWPTSGPAELFADAAEYHRVTREMVERGSAMDAALVNFDVRLSHRYPTVEFRVADACTDLADAMAVAALCRAATEHAAQQHREGASPEPWRTESLRSAAWRAARFGLTDELVSPLSGRLVPAAEALASLLETFHDELDEAGDLDVVAAVVRPEHVGGAQRQRAAIAASGPDGLLADLALRSAGAGDSAGRLSRP